MRDLFYATPARLKFMKTPRTETQAVRDAMERLALGRPDLGFVLVDEERTLLALTPGGGRRDGSAAHPSGAVLGEDVAVNSLAIGETREDLLISGYAGLPTLNRATSREQYFFVNGAPSERSPAQRRVARRLIEELVAGIWIELLTVDRVGRHDNFFELGGHSLLATRLAWEVKVPVATIFTSPTLAELARAIEDNERGGEVMPPIVPIPRDGPREGALVLSYAQQRMWFLQQLAPASAAYHIAIGRRLRGALDIEALRGAIEDLIARHEILRTAFPAPSGIATPHISPPAPWILQLHDLTADPAREAALARIARELTERPFELATEAPIRIELVELGRNDHALLVTLHHIAADGWSVGVLWAELDALYTARKRHRAARSAGADRAVRRLRGVAARGVRGRAARRAAALLDRAPARRARRDRAADQGPAPRPCRPIAARRCGSASSASSPINCTT